MTDRSIRPDQLDQFDHEIQRFLTWHADDVAGAPTATEIVARISSGKRTRVRASRLAPQFVWIVLLGLLLAALIGAALVGASLLRRDPPPPSFAVEPGNGWIAVSANPKGVHGGEAGDIYLVDEDAAPRRIIGSDFDGVAQACPSFSPDGHRLAYGEATASELPVTTQRGHWPVPNRAVVVVDIDHAGDASSPVIRLPVATDPGDIPCPKWSPDSSHVAFRNGSALWVADIENGESTTFRLTDLPWRHHGFAWSGDGSRIAFPESGQIRIVPINAAETTVIPVAGTTADQVYWAAGDDRIVYTSSTSIGSDPHAINVVGVDGDNDRRLAPAPGLQDAGWSFSKAVVSPDGTRVSSFQLIHDGSPTRLVITNIDDLSSVEVPIPPELRTAYGLQWSPDGKRLLLGSIDGVVSVATEAGSDPVIYVRTELDLEWSSDELTWQPVYP